jgi:uncharacterized protein YbaP (TraB family)
MLMLLAGPARPDAAPVWEVRGATNRIHILGSIHFLRAGDSLPPAIVAAYRDADVIVMEIDLDDLDPVASAATMQQLALDPQGRTLDVLLGDRDYQAAVTKARALGLDLSALRPFEPWMAALTVVQLQLVQLGFDAASGVEQQLLRLAERDQKEVRGLETLNEQLSFLDALPPAAQRAFLMQALDEAATMKDDIDDILTAWKAGDTQSMEKEFIEDLRNQPELYRRIVVDRNRNWTGKLSAMTRDRQDYLVVVGTLHLLGPDSLIGMLERAGNPLSSARSLPCRIRSRGSATTGADPRSGCPEGSPSPGRPRLRRRYGRRSGTSTS